MAEEATRVRRHAAPQASAEATPSAPARRRLSLAGLLPLITLLAFSLLYHLYINMFDSDFLVYREISLRRGVVEFSILHYQQWSSRTAIEAVLLLVCRYPQTFLPLDLAILACIYHCLQELFNRRRDLRLSWVIALLLCCYNMHDFDNAGIVATAINYSWPLAGVLYITLTQVRLFRGETVKWWQMVLAVIALVFGANAELLGIVCLVTGVVWLILAKLDQRPITLSVIQIAVSLFWIGWMFFELYGSASSAPSGSDTQGMSIAFMVGAGIGGVIGYILGLCLYFKMQRTNDDILRQIEEITQE